LPTIGTIRVYNDTRRLRRLLRPVRQFDSRTGEEFVAPRAKILFATIARRADRWYVSLTVHAPDFHAQRRHQSSDGRSQGGFVGVDRGLTQFAVAATANGTEISRWPAPRPLVRQLKRVRGCSRSISRKQRGSSNRAKAVRRLSREHARIANLRSGFLHEVSGWLAKTHSRLAIEDLQVANLLANQRLSRAVGDAGWAEFARQLAYKAQWFNCDLVVCDRWFPSTKTCHACGTVRHQMSLGERTFHCDTCGLSCDRDRNAAANLAAWAEHAQAPRTAKRAAGLPRPLEGKALAIASAMVEPAPTKGEPTLGLIT
jgi:putative transposase